MTLRLTLAARITLIVVVSLTMAWIAAIALFYRSQDLEGDGARPSPQQVAAFVRLIERTAPEDRTLILQAVTSSVFVPQLRSDAVSDGPQHNVLPIDDEVRRSYQAVLGNRSLAIISPPTSAAARRFPRLFAAAAHALEFRIGLETGETLIVETRGPLLVSRLGLPVGFGAGLLGTMIALAALIVMQRETRPLARLAAAVDRIDLAGQPALLPEARTSAPEIRALIGAFNRLQSRLSGLLRARMAMLGGISHDVRTFATRLRLRIDGMPEGVERGRAIADIADMIRLLDDALLASRAGAGELAEELVEFDAIVRAEVEDRRGEGQPVDLQVSLDGREPVVLGDRVALRRIVANLVDNAVKYGQAAHVEVDVDADAVVLAVDDEGPGIAPDQREAMLEPFVRLETSRSRRTGGAGLGLAIVRSLVEAHRGLVAITDAPGGGARLMVRLPLFPA